MNSGMLANSSIKVKSGQLDQGIHLPSNTKLELMEFIAGKLPLWRDHPDRPSNSSETALTEHLCNYLNSATCYSDVWSHIQFCTETRDEIQSGRKIDLSVKPCGCALIIEGRRHSQFDALFPVECKRLPTPKAKDRDEREYVITESGSTGGIQRFKLGCHGAAHTIAAMIAYVQEQSFSHWENEVNGWIRKLSQQSNSTWSDSDLLSKVSGNSDVYRLSSHHKRTGLKDCELCHMWIKMN